jgi:hypothetical protein
MLIKNSCNDLTTKHMFKSIASLYLFTITSKLIILPKKTITCRGELLCTITKMTQETEQAAAYQGLKDHREAYTPSSNEGPSNRTMIPSMVADTHCDGG